MNNDTNNDPSAGYSSSSSDRADLNSYQRIPHNDQMNSEENGPSQGYTPNSFNQPSEPHSTYGYTNPTYTGYQKSEPPKQDYITPPGDSTYEESYPGYQGRQNSSQNSSYENSMDNGYYSQNNTYQSNEPKQDYSQTTNYQTGPAYSNNDQTMGTPTGQPEAPNGYGSPSGYNYQPNPSANPYSYTEETSVPQRLPSKKSHKWLWGLTAIPILAIVVVLCFCFVPSFKIFAYRNLLGSTKYYEYVEHSCDEKIIEGLKDNKLMSSVKGKNGSKSTSTISFQSSAATTESLGLDLNKLSCELTTLSKDKRAVINYAFKYDGKALATLELYSDPESGKVYCKIPELSDQYIDYSALLASVTSSEAEGSLPSSISPSAGFLNLRNVIPTDHRLKCASFDSDTAKEYAQKIRDKVNPETLGKLSAEYVKFIMDDLGKRGAIKLSKNTKYEIEHTTEKCDKITISLTQVQVKEVMVDVLKKVKDDKTIQKIVEDVSGLSSVYTAAIDSLITKAKDIETTDSKNPVVKMEVYTNGHTILGRSLSFLEDTDKYVTFEYGMVTEDTKTTVETSLYSNDESYFTLTLSSTHANDEYNGDITLTSGAKAHTISFEDCKLNKENQIEGTFKFTEHDTDLSLTCSGNGDKQNFKLSGKISGTDIGSIIMDTKLDKDASVSIPEVSSSNVVTFNTSTDMVDFLKSSKLEQFLQNILTTFHVDEKLTGKQLSDAIIYSAEHHVSLREALLKIMGGSSTPDSKTPNTPPKTPDGNDNNNSGSTYKPEDYNLPSGTKIEDDGDYYYNLTQDELNALKDKPDDTKALAKTKDEVYPAVEALAKSVCGGTPDFSTDVYNTASGNVKDGSKHISHYTEISWYAPNSYDVYVSLKYDSLSNKVIDIVVSNKDKSKVYNFLTDSCKALGIAEPAADVAKKIQDQINSTNDFSDLTYFSDCELYLSVKKPSSDATYYFKLGAKDSY